MDILKLIKQAQEVASDNENGDFDGWGSRVIAKEFGYIADDLEPVVDELERQKLDEISISWCVDDVLSERPNLNIEQARKVLEMVDRKHDATIGVTWETLQYWADELFPELVGVS